MDIKDVKPTIYSTDWHHKNCFGCGADNPTSLHANFPFDEEVGEVRFTYTFADRFEGARTYCHGGALATLLDEAQGSLCFHLGHFIMTDQLYMDYKKAVPLNMEMTVRCWLTLVRRRRLYTKATMHGPDGSLYVSSKARWFVFPTKLIDKMFGDKLTPEQMEMMRKTTEVNRQRNKEIRKRLRLAKKEI